MALRTIHQAPLLKVIKTKKQNPKKKQKKLETLIENGHFAIGPCD
jgi:hypothetical protein